MTQVKMSRGAVGWVQSKAERGRSLSQWGYSEPFPQL